jgi:hypothetical protein
VGETSAGRQLVKVPSFFLRATCWLPHEKSQSSGFPDFWGGITDKVLQMPEEDVDALGAELDEMLRRVDSLPESERAEFLERLRLLTTCAQLIAQSRLRTQHLTDPDQR